MRHHYECAFLAGENIDGVSDGVPLNRALLNLAIIIILRGCAKMSRIRYLWEFDNNLQYKL